MTDPTAADTSDLLRECQARGYRAVVLRQAAALRAAEAERDAYKALYDDLVEATGCVDGLAFGEQERAAEADLATARAVTDRYSHGWSPMYGPDNGSSWAHAIYAEEPMTEAERVFLAAVSSPSGATDD